MAETLQLRDVFGIRVHPIASYVERDKVDGHFQRALKHDGHIIVYGSSKQGKTALRQKHVDPNRELIVHCSPTSTTEGIYRSLLRQAGIKLETVETQSRGNKQQISTRIGFKAHIPFIGGGEARAEAKGTEITDNTLSWEFIGYDLGDAQAIAELYKRAQIKQFIVLENFHYLPRETQQQLAYDLKTFHELGVRFIILGIWQRSNLLLAYNGDLQDRIAEIPVEPWTQDDFDRVIEAGAQSLNISISKEICDLFKQNAYGNIGLLQEFLRLLCENAGIDERQNTPGDITDIALAKKAIAAKLEDQQGQLINVLQGLAGKSRTRSDEGDPLVLPYYLVHAVLTLPIDVLKEGVSRRELQSHIQKHHHRDDGESPRASDMTNLLTRLPAYQQEMSSPFLDYNAEDRRLRIVDMRNLFVLANADRKELLEEIPFPLRMDDGASDDPPA